MDDFIKQALKISVAQICDNIGWHSITDSSMKILTDILHHYIIDLSVASKKYAEHSYSDVPNIEDVQKAFRQKSISLIDLCRYLKSNTPVKFPHSLPPLNIPGKDTLNAMKPGSREIVTRPIHIHEHLPTLCTTEPMEEGQSMETEEIQNKIEGIQPEPDEVIIHKRLREIASVVMTSGGFLSPSREGRLAESKLLPFSEIKIDKPTEPSNLNIASSSKKEEISRKVLVSKKKIKSKKIKLGIKKTPKISKNLLMIKDQKSEVLKKVKKPKENKTPVSKEPVIEPVVDEVVDVVNVIEPVEVPKKVIPTPQLSKGKIEEVLPKFSFFGPLPLPQGPGLIPSTFSQIINTPDETAEKPASPPISNVENEDISRKEQKKKKKDKKKEKKREEKTKRQDKRED